MNGNSMYEVARQRIAEQQRAARQAGEARERRAAARGRRARKEATEAVATPAIPDFAARDVRRGTGRGSRAAAGNHARPPRAVGSLTRPG